MVVFYATHGHEPWNCHFCGSTVTVIGKNTWDGNVHHVDGDESNDVSGNVVMVHTICHQQHHAPTKEQRAAISRKLKGRQSPTRGMHFSEETNRKKSRPGESNPFYGCKHSAEDIRKMSKPRQRVMCSDCGKSYAVNWIKRHVEAGKCIVP